MKKILIFLLAFMLFAPACSKKKADRAPSDSGAFLNSEKSQRGKDTYLSYEHSFTIDTTSENLSKSYNDTIDACINNEKCRCSILDSRIATGKYPSAYIKLRIEPEGVKNVLEVASNKGTIFQESTHIEDLAKPIVDNNQRLDMLKSQYDQLIELQKKAGNDIDALIKVSSEISKVQSEIESATGDKEFLQQRVSMDIVNFDFQVEYYRSFWRPIREALSDFSNNLSDGISGTIIAIAYLLPVIIILLFVFFFVRFIWKKVHKSK